MEENMKNRKYDFKPDKAELEEFEELNKELKEENKKPEPKPELEQKTEAKPEFKLKPNVL